MNKQLRILVLLSLFFCYNESCAQETDARLVEFKGQEAIELLEPAQLAYLEFVLDNIFVIQDFNKPGGTFPDAQSIIKTNPNAPDITSEMTSEEINPFYYNFENALQQQIFSLGEGKILIVRSEKGLREHFEQGKEYISP